MQTKKYMTVAIAISAVLMMVIAAVALIPIDNKSQRNEALSLEYSLEELGISEKDASALIDALSSKVIYVETDEDGVPVGSIVDTLDKGRFGAERTSDGVRVYVDSLTCSLGAGAIGVAVGAAVGSLIPVYGTIVGAIAGLAISTAITEGVDTSNGIVVVVKLFNNHRIFGVNISIPCSPTLVSLKRQ